MEAPVRARCESLDGGQRLRSHACWFLIIYVAPGGAMEEFKRIRRLPPYVFSIVTELKVKARARGEDIIDFGMGNPDLATPDHIVDKLVEAARNPRNHRYSASRGITKLRHGICDWYHRRYG